ncbi:ROK family transcriptional regulator [Herbidospora daliensis]|uniref:ROK family transcriptional regulator n=1 Tax=Herbidospora daliensis TaxID=295585 RepID=UPI000A595E96|nr:ROK family transcriptional regulator [Herbidospora daliensis]
MKPPLHGTPSLMRAINEGRALRVLLDRGPLTRPEIGELTGLSKPTAFQLLARLQEAGLVVADGIRAGQPGPTAEIYRINPDAAYVAALDVTHDRISVQIADLTGTIRGAHTLPQGTPDPLVDRLAAAIAAAGPPGPLRRIVIGVQGAVDPTTGLLSYATDEDLPGWRIPDLLPTLREGLGTEVDVENDVNLVALAEQAHGAAGDHSDFVLLWADEGLGSALVIGGRLHRGFFGGAGEVGYMPTPGVATARDGGRFGHHGYQALVGGPAVHDLLRTYGVEAPDFSRAMTAAVALSQGTDRAAEEARAGLRLVASRLAVGLAAIASVVDPGLVVLTGGLPTAGGEVLRDLVERELHALTHSRPQVRLSALEGNPVLAGALELGLTSVREELFEGVLISRS